jgi:hypothetical protein
MHKQIGLGVMLALCLATSGCGSWFYTGQHPSVAHSSTLEHMPEEIRRSVNSVEVIPDNTRPRLRVGGDYGQQLSTVGEGVGEGMAAGAQATGGMLAEDPRAIIIAPFILPIALVAGGIAGAAAAKIENELAEYRENLADELLADGNQPVPNDALAAALVERLEETEGIRSVTEGGDATLTVSVSSVSIDTANEDAVITAFATGVLRSAIDESVLYSKSLKYSESDKLRNWTANENALWDAYVASARKYLAAEFIADLFEIIRVRHVLRPVRSETFTGGWSGRAKTDKPTFSWELFLLGGDSYHDHIDEQDITFDLRVFEGSRLAYEATRIAGNSHEVAEPLPRCKELRWSVRPVYLVDGMTRAGEWMQYRSGFDKFWNNDALEANPVTPEFWQYFPEVSSRCTS